MGIEDIRWQPRRSTSVESFKRDWKSRDVEGNRGEGGREGLSILLLSPGPWSHHKYGCSANSAQCINLSGDTEYLGIFGNMYVRTKKVKYTRNSLWIID